MKIFLASDHGGFELKKLLIEHLQSKGYDIKDFGAYELTPDDDFVDFVNPLAKEISDNPDQNLLGIVICKNGVGVCMAANKFKGIRAGLSWNKEHAKSSKNDDATNVLALPSVYIDTATALEIVDTWLNTPPSQEERFIRRRSKIW